MFVITARCATDADIVGADPAHHRQPHTPVAECLDQHLSPAAETAEHSGHQVSAGGTFYHLFFCRKFDHWFFM